MAGGFSRENDDSAINYQPLPQVAITTTNQLTFFNHSILRTQVTATSQPPPSFSNPFFSFRFFFIFSKSIPPIIDYPSRSHGKTGFSDNPSQIPSRVLFLTPCFAPADAVLGGRRRRLCRSR